MTELVELYSTTVYRNNLKSNKKTNLSGIITEHIGEVVQFDLEDLLGGLGLGASGVDEGGVGVERLGVGSPESLGTASVELSGFLGESESVIASDAADLEATAWTPVLTGLDSTNWGIERGAERVWNRKRRILVKTFAKF